jgi:hypothetical protein
MNDDEDDMSNTIAPKSDQLQADDLVGGRTITIKINRRENKKGVDQPLSLFYDGDNGKPYKPSKGMRHVLIGLYGKSSKNYVGHSLTLYRDEKVTFGPDTTGGVRISNATGITKPMTIIIPVKRGIRKPFTVQPLIISEPNKPDATQWEADIMAVTTLDELKTKFTQAQTVFKGSTDFARIHTAKEKRKAELLTEATSGA